MVIKSVPGAPKLYVFHDSNSACVFCSFFSVFFSVGKEGAADYFKDDILTSLKENDSIKFDLRVALNCVREKGKPWLKNTY